MNINNICIFKFIKIIIYELNLNLYKINKVYRVT